MATKKTSRVVPTNHNDKLGVLEQILVGKERELQDATFSVGSLTIKNQRQEQMINELMNRLSKYEDIQTGELVKNPTGGGENA